MKLTPAITLLFGAIVLIFFTTNSAPLREIASISASVSLLLSIVYLYLAIQFVVAVKQAADSFERMANALERSTAQQLADSFEEQS